MKKWYFGRIVKLFLKKLYYLYAKKENRRRKEKN